MSFEFVTSTVANFHFQDQWAIKALLSRFVEQESMVLLTLEAATNPATTFTQKCTRIKAEQFKKLKQNFVPVLLKLCQTETLRV